MKIEKVSENQIRCTLTKEDLADRQIKLSELAYGTEKAKALFRDMMQQAAYECGFEAEDIPLMIEAIPLSADTIILIVTKVEYPEELDTRFSQFAPGDMEDIEEEFDSEESEKIYEAAGADDILDLFRKIQEEHMKAESLRKESQFVPLEKAITGEKPVKQPEQEKVVVDITKLFVFDGFEEVNRLAHVLKGFYNGCNVLYKNRVNRKYYLVISKSQHSPEEFNKVCNILSEYAHQEKYSNTIRAYFEEHYDTILKENALQILSEI